jgi:hypothetical protein
LFIARHDPRSDFLKILRIQGICNVVPDYYLIHQMGKVASQSVEAAIRHTFPAARVERHHYLSDANLTSLQVICRLPGAGNVGAERQLHAAITARADLIARGELGGWVLSGFRDPLKWAVSGFFQNLSAYCPWLTYKETNLRDESARLISFFNAEFERVSSNRPPLTFQEGLLDFKLCSPERWFDREFVKFHGIDVYDYPMRSAPYLIIRKNNLNFLLYRFEDLPISFHSLLEAIGLPTDPSLSAPMRLNVTKDKPVGNLYHAFCRAFMPTDEMTEYYFGGKYFRHFYGDSQGDAHAFPTVAGER